MMLGLAALWLAVTHPMMMLRHRRKMGSWPNPGWPRSYSEKTMWRKLLDRNPLFVTATDKLTAKDYISAILPGLPQPEVLWAGDSAAAIPESVMAGPALVKPTNGSGRNYLVEAGQPNREAIGNATRHLLAPGGYRRREEWAYWPVQGRLLAEGVLSLGGGDLPTDLKAYVAGGRV